MKTTTVQLPKALLKTIQETARREGRSVASQIRMMLADAITRKPATP